MKSARAVSESRLGAVVLSALLAACSGGAAVGGNTAGAIAQPPERPESFASKCDVAKQTNRPLVVEWPAPDRAALEALARRGQLVVHWEGCQLEILRQCAAPKEQSYAYTAITPKTENVSIRNEDELYASIPVYAAQFEGKLEKSGQLAAKMTIVGVYESPGVPTVSDLVGDCEGATHVVTALTTGAFEFFAGADAEVGASATVLGAGAGAKSAAGKETLSKDGDVIACGDSKSGDKTPPDRCGALLRLELAKVRPARSAEEVAAQQATAKQAQEKRAQLAPEDAGVEDANELGNRCYKHFKLGQLDFARAACVKATTLTTDAKILGAVYYNLGLVENTAGDGKQACAALRQSLGVRDNPVVRKKYDELSCASARE